MPMRHDVILPEHNAVERATDGDEVFAALGADEFFDEFIDDWVLDADNVAAAFDIGLTGVPIIKLFVAGRERLSKHIYGDVEIKIIETVLELRSIDDAQIGFDAETL